MRWVALLCLALSGCSFVTAASGEFTPPDCAAEGPIVDGIVAALSVGGCIALAATDDGRDVIPQSVYCLPLGVIALTTAISGLYGVSKRDECRRTVPS